MVATYEGQTGQCSMLQVSIVEIVRRGILAEYLFLLLDRMLRMPPHKARRESAAFFSTSAYGTSSVRE